MRKKVGSEVSSCELPARTSKVRKTRESNACAFYKHRKGFRWTGIRGEPYKQKSGDWANIVRKVLIGSHGESTKFHVRYFEIFPGGNSSLERHRHEHVVICVRGEGVVLTGRLRRRMGFMDTVYISPDTPHQFLNPYGKPFGFLCIVNARRDRPKLIRT
jgi:ribulose-bisphosphate carboxylase large chain